MRRVECVGLDFSRILVDADKIVYCHAFLTNSGEPRLELYFSTSTDAEPLCVRVRPWTLDALMPERES